VAFELFYFLRKTSILELKDQKSTLQKTINLLR
jgi:hypothetical protein